MLLTKKKKNPNKKILPFFFFFSEATTKTLHKNSNLQSGLQIVLSFSDLRAPFTPQLLRKQAALSACGERVLQPLLKGSGHPHYKDPAGPAPGVERVHGQVGKHQQAGLPGHLPHSGHQLEMGQKEQGSSELLYAARFPPHLPRKG